MGVKASESILIVTDTATSRLIAKSFFDAASTIGCEVMLFEMLSPCPFWHRASQSYCRSDEEC